VAVPPDPSEQEAGALEVLPPPPLLPQAANDGIRRTAVRAATLLRARLVPGRMIHSLIEVRGI
jgi:hypothetical protein